jgi:dTDP-4-amino-4,6-dideoxygalactose transaminase
LREIPLCVPALGDEEIEAVSEVLRSGWLAHGPKNREFEQRFCKLLGVRHAVSMNSCTSALFAALLALRLRGEVIAPSFTFVATVNSILLAGATPVLVDVNDDGNLHPGAVEAAITPRTEALMVVHFAGLPADMRALGALAERHGLRVIEDSAECLGATCHGVQAGSHDVGCFSFFPTKNVTTGEGGMLATDDDEVARRVRRLCAHGIDSTTFERERAERPWVRIASEAGLNFRLSNALAAIGVEQMKKLPALNRARSELAERYLRQRREVPGLRCPRVPAGFTCSWQMFTVQVDPSQRNDLLHHLRARGIGASVHFEPAVHEQEAYRELRRGGSLANTERIVRSILTLPIYPGMSEEDVDYVCEQIRAFPGLA